jgi:quinol monooxygenase YgiN
MSHTVVAEFSCSPGKGAEFLGLLLPALADTRAFKGCELIETYTDQSNPDLVVLWEKWATREDQEAYMAWRAETGMIDMIGPFMAAAPRFVHLAAAD